jgi:hypothetical protein
MRLLKHIAPLAATLAAAWAGNAQAVERTCPLDFTNSVQVITLAGVQTTSSTTPVNLPGAAFSFDAGSPCLVVEVTGQVRAQSPRALRLRLNVAGDLNGPPFPRTRDVYTADASFDGRSATFFADLLAGHKALRVQFMSADGTPVSLSKGMIVIYYTQAGS